MNDAHADGLGMDAYAYAGLDDAMDYLYDFLDQDLEERLRADREFIPAGLEDLLAEDSVADHVWLWLKDAGPNGFLQYLRDGGFAEEECARALRVRLREWAYDSPPHLAWMAEDAAAAADSAAEPAENAAAADTDGGHGDQ